MRFNGLAINNFLAIGEAKLSLADRGLVLIQGVNEDDSSAESNGAGKSTIADALCWVLYGVTARGEEGDKVVNREAGKNCFVMVDIEDGDDVFRIARYRKHKTGKNAVTVLRLAKDGAITELTKGTDKLTQAVIEQIIGCSYDVFTAAIYAGQERMPDLPAMTDKQLKVIVEEAAGVTMLEKAYEEARSRLSAIKSECDVFETRLSGAKNLVENEKDRITSDIAAAIEDFEKTRKANIEIFTGQARCYATTAKEFVSDLKGTDRRGVEAAIKKCDDAIAAVSAEQKQDRENETDLNAVGRIVATYEDQVKNAKRHLESFKAELAKVDHEIGCACSSCKRPITAAEIAPRRAVINDKISDMTNELKRVKDGLERAQKSLARATETRNAFRASMTDVSKTSAQRASLLEDLRGIGLLEKRRDEAVAGAKRYVEKIDALKAQANPHHEVLEKAKARVITLEKEVEGLERLRSEKFVTLKVAELTAKVFSPAGVRAHILDDVTPFLNDQTAKYLATLSDGNINANWSTLVKNAKGELKEKFSIEVTNATGGETFKSISGGEKRKVRLAATLALQDLVARRASKPIELFLGDEIDDALDSAGLERLTTILEEKARERGSVFVVSHRDLKSWISQVVNVTKKDGRATITETIE